MLLAALVYSQAGVTGAVKSVRNIFYCYQISGDGAISFIVLFQEKIPVQLCLARYFGHAICDKCFGQKGDSCEAVHLCTAVFQTKAFVQYTVANNRGGTKKFRTNYKTMWKALSGTFSDYQINREGVLRKKKNGAWKVLKGSGEPYHKFTLTGKNGKRVYKRRHMLVARAFLGAAKGRVVDHINQDKKDDRVTNLRYLSKSDNRRTKWGGIKFIPETGDWGVRIYDKSFPKKYKYIGSFPSKQGALNGKKQYLTKNLPHLLQR